MMYFNYKFLLKILPLSHVQGEGERVRERERERKKALGIGRIDPQNKT